jgi:hypothetical protein
VVTRQFRQSTLTISGSQRKSKSNGRLLDAPDLFGAPAAEFSFPAADTQNRFQSLKPPVRVAKFGRRAQTAF